MASIRINNSQILSCKYSPHQDGLVSCTTTKADDVFGPGSLNIYRLNDGEQLDPVNCLAWESALLDTCWAYTEYDIIFAAAADGSIPVWKRIKNFFQPVLSSFGHSGPVTSVQCLGCTNLLSASLDGSHKIWDIKRESLVTSRKFEDVVLQASSCPFTPNLIATTLGKRKIEITDDRCYHKALFFLDQALSCDWSPFRATDLLVSSSSGSIESVDLRTNLHQSANIKIQCHQGPARRALWLPAYADLVVSVGFDGTTAISDVKSGSVLERIRHHSNFVYDVDVSPIYPNLLMDCSWDSLLHIFSPRCLQSRRSSFPLCNKL